MTELLECQRHLFDLPPGVTYLNCAYMSPSLKTVTAAGERGARIKAHPWRIEPRDFFAGADAARTLFAGLIGAGTDDIAIVPSASYGIASAAANLPLAEGQTIVLLEEQFPSNVFQWRRRADEARARIVTVARPHAGDGSWSEAVLAAIGEDTAVVALPHCHWTDGALMDLAAISRRCRTVGAALVLDLSQSLGALPIGIGTVDADFLVTPCYKWLLGPYSLGFLYVAPRHQNGIPLEETWIGRQGAEDFARLTAYTETWDTGARRFDMGARAHFHLLPMACAALAQIGDWQIPRIAATLGRMTGEIADRAQALGLAVPPEAERAPHFIGLRFPGGMPEGLLGRLKERDIYVSARGDALRVTPHLYNGTEDIDVLFSSLKELM
ncbi:MAG: aminotransferase class V-fold PLP-dependent enzyme [Alphaproteobacteria bacterium]